MFSFQKILDFLTTKTDIADSTVFIGADVPIIVTAGEPICTVIVEGAGVVEVKNQSEDTKSS